MLLHFLDSFYSCCIVKRSNTPEIIIANSLEFLSLTPDQPAAAQGEPPGENLKDHSLNKKFKYSTLASQHQPMHDQTVLGILTHEGFGHVH